MRKPTFYISSPFDTYSGYGARARDIIKAIIEIDKYDVKLIPQPWGSTSWNFCTEHAEWKYLLNFILKPSKTPIKPDIWMQITIPNEFSPAGRYNIGCTAGVEATACKPEWIDGLNRMDINFVSSTFTKKMFEEVSYTKQDNKTKQVIGKYKVEKPLEVIFEGANLDIYKTTKTSDFNLEGVKEKFAYLFVGHWMQGNLGHDRKNVGLLVKAFFETFKNKKNKPALILKASVGGSSYMSRDNILNRIMKIRKTVNSKNLPNIYLINGEFTDIEMNELYNHPKVKAMVTLTKGEGFGRPLLEFSLTNKPIIATDWSGHKDFLNEKFVSLVPGDLENIHPSACNQWLIKEAQWFKPDQGYVGHYFKDVYENYKDYAAKGKRQGYYARTNFSWEKMKELVEQTLDKIMPEFPEEIPLNLPQVNLPKPNLPDLPKLEKVK